ncbi:MAG: malate dehydrogenase [candidate division Zixibacteria bacterium]|nr:malate dehydrogenase [candidate division Zixibacteria bacterium]
MPKIGIVGSGNVGATTALYVAQLELGDVALIDIVEGVPQGKALDMLEAGPVLGFDSHLEGSSDFAALDGSDIVVVTAGLARKPGMDRLDLLKKNAEIITSVTENIVRYAPNSQILMVSNPLDVMTYIALKISGFGRKRVYGQAGVLDCARYRSFVAMELGVSMEDTSAIILGGHGDTMVPLPRYTTVAGIPITELIAQDRIDAIVQRARDGGAEIVNLLKTGSAYYAPAAAVAQMVESVIKDKNRLLPASVLLEGEYGLHNVCIGVPVKLGANGIEEIYELNLTPEEKNALHTSAGVYRQSLGELGY